MKNKEEVKNNPQEQENIKTDNIEPPKEETTSEKKEEVIVEEAPKKAEKIVNPDAFNSDERVLYEIKEEKQRSPIIVLILFILLTLFIFNLPKINDFVQKKFGHTFTKTPNVSSSNVSKEEEEKEEKNKFHDALNRVRIGDLDVFQVDTTNQRDEYFITFTITNNGDTTYNYKQKYYIVLYEDDRAIYRALIQSYNPLASHASAELRLVTNKNAFDKANNFKLEQISESLYEEKELTKKEDDYMVLSCNYRNNNMNYYFKDNMLDKISETYTVSTSEPDYDTLNQYYSELSQNYNNMTGIESIFYGRPDSFEMINTFTLSEIQEVDLEKLRVYRYFKYKTNSNVVAFEMTSMGYICS